MSLRYYLFKLVYFVIYGSGSVFLEHLLLSWYPTNPESLTYRRCFGSEFFTDHVRSPTCGKRRPPRRARI
jgi:hypothetical protein